MADIALKDALGSGWWLPLPLLALSSFLCAKSPSSSDGDPDSDLGPKPRGFSAKYGSQDPQAFKSQMLADLGQTLDGNHALITRKKEGLLQAEIILVAAVLVSIVPLIGVSEVVGWYVYSGVTTWHLAQSAWHWLGPAIASVGREGRHFAEEAVIWAWHRMAGLWHLIKKTVG